MFYSRQLSTTSWKYACWALSTTSRNDTLTRHEATQVLSTTSRNDIRVSTSLLEAFDAGPAYIVSNTSSANLAVARQTRSRSRKALASAATDPQQEAAMLQAGAAAGAEA